MMNEIKLRRSIRKYTAKPVADEKIMQLIESARLAPSGNNTQPWHFIIIRDEGIKQQIAKVSHNQKWMLSAP
ncbi:MAG: nitroreductase family protein, partial [Thermodesulfovibrionales bacterium]|nr:nitroreductase family protein [Thermodesulfovibrionales bacterium]